MAPRQKLPATVQVDVDGLDILLKHHGLPVGAERDFVFLSGLPRFLELFERWGAKATFFIVGSDLDDPEKLAIVERLVAAGHEVGNHTMSHPASLSSLAADAQEAEIADCEERCVAYLGVKPVGFRAPNFDVDEKTAAILDGRGYLYDSSVLAMPYGPLLRWCKGRVAADKAPKSLYLGRAAFGLAPLQPYRLGRGALWRRGQRALVEVPVTTMPYLRLPFHASFNLAFNSFGLGNVLFDVGYAFSWRTQTPLNYVFHVCELADMGQDRRLDRHWGLGLPVGRRERMADALLEKITRRYKVATTHSMIAGGGGCDR